MAELSKSDKKLARAIIHKGMMVEFEQGMKKADKILNDWKKNSSNPQEAYYALYGHIDKFDRHIARRYDNLGNDILVFVLIQQLNEGLIKEDEFSAFSVEAKELIQRVRGLK